MARLVALLPLLLLALLAAVPHAARAQALRSPFPSRSAILAAERVTRLQNGTAEAADTGAQLRRSGRNVLGYVTPWNPRGTGLVEKYRHKFTHVAPCWHTVDPVHTGATTWYEVRGEPTEEDAAWMRRLQLPAKNQQGEEEGEGRVKVVPRFALDNTWTAELLAELLSSDSQLRSFVDGIISHVQAQGYDGLVLEVGAVWALEHLIKELSEALHAHDKVLGIVLPPFRRIKEGEEAGDEARMNVIALQAYKALSPLVDLITSMTYDYSGMKGLAYADIFDVDALPSKSPLRQDGVRVPGPNTPLEWLRENIEMLQGTLEVDGGAANGLFGPGSGAGFAAAGFDMTTAQYVEHHGVRQKLLMGFPLYGYAYPVGWFDKESESTNGVPKIPPPSPLVSKDNNTDAQAAARAKADKKEADSRLQAVLRFAGQPFTHSELIARLEDHKALIRQEPQSGEQYIDFVAPMPSHQQPADVPPEANGGKPFASYYRAYWPSANTMAMRAEVLRDYEEVGVALWDVGQAGEWLLAEL